MLPLSFAQQRLWFLSRLEGPNSTYNVPLVVRLLGGLDLRALASSLRDVVERHESLRTVFPEVGDQPRQLVLGVDEFELDISVVECAPDDLAAALRVVADHAFDLSVEMPIRVHLFAVGPDEHVLVLLLHHVASDGWSLGPLWRDVAAAYEARVAGRIPGWEPLPVQYADYTLWQRELLGSEDDPGSVVSQQLAFWREQLAGVPEELELPADRVRPAVSSYRGGRVEFVVPARLHAGLTGLARESRTTLFMVLQAGVAALLSRLGAGTDIPLGTAAAGRTDEALDELVGFFVNSLVLRTDVSGDPSFRELLARVRATDLAAFAHQDLPFERLVEDLNPTRTLSRHPLFQVMVVLQNNIETELELCGLGVEIQRMDTTTAKTDLTVLMAERFGPDGSPDGVALELEYSSDLFDRATVELLGIRLQRLLAAAVATPDAPVGRLELLSQDERRDLLTELSGAAAGNTVDRCVHQLFEEQATRTPQATALVFGAETLGYAELNERANRFARYMTGQGVRRGDVVGVYVERGIELVVVLLGVLKAGAAYTVLDVDYPTARLNGSLERVDAAAVVVGQAWKGRLVHPTAHFIHLDEVADAVSAEAADDLGLVIDPEEICCIMFTSGSTGVPKGVAAPHRALAGTVQRQDFAEFDSEQVWLQCAPVSWDAFNTELFYPLTTGAVCVLQPGQKPEPRAVAELIARHGITVLECSASLFNHLVDENPEAIARLRRCMPGGEPASPGHAAIALRDVPGIRLTNGYGPVESMGFTTAHEITEVDCEGTSVPIGGPLAGKHVYVLDTRLQLVPREVIGELYVAGVGLAHGYFGQSGLTAERFVASPFGGPGERMYRTGDLVRWNDRGVLDFVGRVDEQVKLRGFRVEPAEVEAVLRRRSDVARTAVLVREDQPGDKRMVAYVVPTGQAAPEAAVLREHLSGTLPEYLIPSAFVLLDALPLTPNGKLDRRALPAPDYAALSAGRPARSPREELLAGLFAEVLGLDSVSIDDDFFELGGHSLLATRMVSRIRTTLGYEVGIRALFDSPTVAGLLTGLDVNEGTRSALRAVERPETVPLSFAQQRLWFLSRLEGPNSTYNVPLVVRLLGGLDLRALASSLRDVVERHESLRTVFPEVGDQPRQLVLGVDEFELDISVVECAPDDLAAALRVVADHAFDLSVEMPIRVHLFAVGPDEHVLVLLLHHVASDGWSLGPLWRDVAAAYEARVAGRIPGWEPLPVQYADYTLWQRELLGSEDDPGSVVSQQLAFWREQLAGVPEELELPADRVRPAVSSYRGGRVEFVVPARLHAGLTGLARESRTTLFMVLQAGVAALLSRLGAGTDIPLGTAAAGRTDEALDELVGFFVNSLVLRTDVSGDPSFRELLARVRATDLAAFAHQDLPFERLVEDLNPTRTLSRHPLFQVMVELHNNETPDFRAAEVHGSFEPFDLDAAKFDLSWEFLEVPGAAPAAGLAAELGYAADLFDYDTAERMAAWLILLLEAAVAEPDAPIGRLELVTADERRQLLHGHYRAPLEALDKSVVQRIRDHALVQPEALAVIDDQEKLSYAQFVGRASRVARRLAVASARSGQVVALLASRGGAAASGIAGILNAGCVYLPLDTNAPPARSTALLQDAQAAFLLAGPGWLEPARRLAAAAGHPVEVIELDAETDALDDLAQILGDPYDPAYVIFTSGSTGRPKGAIVHRRGMVNNLLCEAEAIGVTGADVVSSTAPLTFDISIWQMFVPLILGGTVRAMADEVVRDPRSLFKLASDEGVTVMQVVPSLLQTAIDDWDARQDGSPSLSLRVLAVTGEALPAEVCRRWFEYLPAIPIVNCYGPTECSDDVTHAIIHADTVPPDSRTPIGRAIRGSRLYVLDDNLKLAPIGVPGELYIGGLVVGCGYLADPRRTAAAFVADPFTAEPGRRMYRTGDMVRYRRDGQLDFLGRRDHQVKIRGQRIELGEVEHVLRRTPGVRDAVVTAADGPGGHKVIVAHYTGDVPVSAVRTELTAVLSEAMVPGVLVPMEAFPLTPNGKLDRKALPAPDLSAASSTGRVPRTSREKALCSLFEEVLGVSGVGIDDNFFELGGHSLLTIRLVRRIQQELGVELPLSSVFENRTVVDLDGKFEVTSGADEHVSERGALTGHAELDPTIRTDQSLPVDWLKAAQPENVLLTGCTGFLGAFLLQAVLDQTRARVWCLVRAADEAAAMKRICRSLAGYGIRSEDLAERVIAVPGDLERSLLGMPAERFDELAGLIDAIYHNGARVNLMDPYERLKAANVNGTQEVFRLAAQGRVKPVHYVSTISTLVAGPGDPEVLPEEWQTEESALGSNGYVRTKWVAERMAQNSLERGIPVAVYRPGRISGHSLSGATGTGDAFWHYVRACIELRAAPDAASGAWAGMEENLVPVDHVARAFVHLATHCRPDGTAYSLLNPALTHIHTVLDHARARGYTVEPVPYAEWTRRLADAAAAAQAGDSTSLPAVTLLNSGMDESSRLTAVGYSRANTEQALAGSGIDCPRVDEDVLDRYFDFFVRSGFLAARDR